MAPLLIVALLSHLIAFGLCIYKLLFDKMDIELIITALLILSGAVSLFFHEKRKSQKVQNITQRSKAGHNSQNIQIGNWNSKS